MMNGVVSMNYYKKNDFLVQLQIIALLYAFPKILSELCMCVSIVTHLYVCLFSPGMGTLLVVIVLHLWWLDSLPW